MSQSSIAAVQTANPDPLLADLVEELTARLQAGEAVDLAAYADEHPEQAEQLRQLFPALQMLADAGSSARPAPVKAPDALPAVVPGVLGDYRIIREIGRGGMGIVYEAEQISLRRRVALKVLPFAAILDPRQLQRFHNEAQAAACLHHNHIVPVFAVGTERGLHYYAMQFIEGQTLAQVIADWRLQIANVKKESSDSDGTGPYHAKPQAEIFNLKSEICNPTVAILSTERSTKSPAFFRAAAKLGRQAALALEHAHQQGVVHRDIKPANLLVDQRGELWITDFGLARSKGDTELTRTGDLLGTLRYMSPEQAQGKPGLMDHRTDIYSLGATLYELLTLQPAFAGRDREQLLRQIDADDARPLRRFNKTVPAELEIIVLKSLAKHPAERYATAQEMAEDLERFLEDKPILARRPSLWDRAARWSRRHKSVVAASVLILVIAMLSLLVSTVFFVRQRNEKEGRLRDMRNVMDKMQNWLTHQPLLEPLQRQVLLEALRYYQEFIHEGSGDPALALETGKAYHRVAYIQYKLGQLAESEDAYTHALALLKQIMSEPGASADCRSELAACQNDWGSMLRDTGRYADAETAYNQARVLFAELATDEPERTDSWDGLAGSSNDLGIVLAALGRPQEAEKAYRQGLTIFRKLSADDSSSPHYRHDLASSLNNLANVLRDTARFKEADKCYRNALDIWLNLAKEYPGQPVYRQALASNYHSAAALYLSTGRLPEAEETYRKALTLREKLAIDFPAVPVYRQAQAVSLNRLGFVLVARGRAGEAEHAYRQSIAALEKLVSEASPAPAYRLELAAAENDLAALLQNTDRLQEAEKGVAQAQTLAERLRAEFVGVPEYRWLLASTDRNSGGLLLAAGRNAEAEEAFRRALTHAEKLVIDCPLIPRYRGELAWFLATCPVVTLRDPPRAVVLATRLVEQMPEDSQTLIVLGVAQLRAGEYHHATTALQKAKDLARGDSAALRFYLAMAHCGADEGQLARRSYEHARVLMQKTNLCDRELRSLQAEAAALLRVAEPR